MQSNRNNTDTEGDNEVFDNEVTALWKSVDWAKNLKDPGVQMLAFCYHIRFSLLLVWSNSVVFCFFFFNIIFKLIMR